MTANRTIALFKNDIAATIADARDKGKDETEVAFRVESLWKITMDEWNAAQN